MRWTVDLYMNLQVEESSNSTSRDASYWNLRYSSSLEYTMTALPKPHGQHVTRRAADEPFTKQRSELDFSFTAIRQSSIICQVADILHLPGRQWRLLGEHLPHWRPPQCPSSKSLLPPRAISFTYKYMYWNRFLYSKRSRQRGLINPLLPAVSPWIAQPQILPLYRSEIHLHIQIYKPRMSLHRRSRGAKRSNSAPNCAP